MAAKSFCSVTMGLNGAIALTEADIGLHINEGTNIAQSAADAYSFGLISPHPGAHRPFDSGTPSYPF